MHRQGQGASALRIWRQGLARHDPASLEGRSVHCAREGDAGQPLRRPYAGDRPARDRGADRRAACPVKFWAPSGQLEFSNETLALPLITQDACLLEMLRPFCEEAERARKTAASLLRDAVASEVARLLPNAQVKVETVAMALASASRPCRAGCQKRERPSRALLTNCAKASRSGISRKRASWWRRSHGFWVTSARRRSNELQATRRYRRFCAFRPHSAPGASNLDLLELAEYARFSITSEVIRGRSVHRR
jgi:hypothetical protein